MEINTPVWYGMIVKAMNSSSIGNIDITNNVVDGSQTRIGIGVFLQSYPGDPTPEGAHLGTVNIVGNQSVNNDRDGAFISLAMNDSYVEHLNIDDTAVIAAAKIDIEIASVVPV